MKDVFSCIVSCQLEMSHCEIFTQTPFGCHDKGAGSTSGLIFKSKPDSEPSCNSLSKAKSNSYTWSGYSEVQLSSAELG